MFKFLSLSLVIHSFIFINYSFNFTKENLSPEIVEFSFGEEKPSKPQSSQVTGSKYYKTELLPQFTNANELKSIGQKSSGNNVRTYIGLGVEFDSSQFFVNIQGEGRLVGYKVIEVNHQYGAFYAGVRKDDIILKVKGFSVKNKISFIEDEQVDVLVLRSNTLIVLKVRVMKIPYV